MSVKILSTLGQKKVSGGVKAIFQVLEENGLNGKTSIIEKVRVVGISKEDFKENLKNEKNAILSSGFKEENLLIGVRRSISKEELVFTSADLEIINILQEELGIGIFQKELQH